MTTAPYEKIMNIHERIALIKNHPGCKFANEQDLTDFAYHTLVNSDFMELYVSSTETYISLAIAALGLSVAFKEKVLGIAGVFKITPMLLTAWTLLSFSIISGAYYLYAAPKHMEMRYQCSHFMPYNLSPGEVYGACTVFLVLGIFSLFIFMVRQAQKNGIKANPRLTDQ